ncbi:HAD hydrolase family protein [Corynebacterium meridianum]|uniref:HAD family hydrolase n=1 Tax=Corynebacterium meridianum TaxID=2765363 RepID=A0A934M9F8_9CORY|nr:HAD family hydrolase [Corynebacterium meridianum]MCK7678487.1 HAD family hydrolase [Corynebacterium meridianum]
MSRPLLVGSDIDGTLITSAERVSPRTRECLSRFIDAGGVLALATGRPPRWLLPVLEQLPVRPMAVCANGAVLYDSATDRIVDTHPLLPDQLRTIVDTARAILAADGGVGVAVERAGNSAFDPQPELFIIAPEWAHAWPAIDFGEAGEDELLAEPAIKLLLRNEGLDSGDMYRRLAPAIPPEMAHLTYSVSEGLLEVAAPGITKAVGLREISRTLGIPAERAICFGDMPNDTEMLRWAGRGVAMGNAAPELKIAADETTVTNDEDGLAAVLERWY